WLQLCLPVGRSPTRPAPVPSNVQTLAESKPDGCGIIVTADDFGMSTEINRAIALAWEQRLISRTSIMANMAGFPAACELVERYELHRAVGLHLNLSEGWPLTDAMRRCRRFCGPSGAFNPRRTIAFLSRADARVVEGELD